MAELWRLINNGFYEPGSYWVLKPNNAP